VPASLALPLDDGDIEGYLLLGAVDGHCSFDNDVTPNVDHLIRFCAVTVGRSHQEMPAHELKHRCSERRPPLRIGSTL
jgi:hypothetical protein